MELSNRRFADVTVAAPAGRIDHPNAQSLQEALAPILDDLRLTKGALLLDFEGVEYISSMGLRVLMMAAKQMRSQGERVAVASLQPAAAEIFEIARFKHVVEVFPSVRVALQELSPAALAAYEAAAK